MDKKTSIMFHGKVEEGPEGRRSVAGNYPRPVAHCQQPVAQPRSPRAVEGFACRLCMGSQRRGFAGGIGALGIFHVLGRFRTDVHGLGIITNGLDNRNVPLFACLVLQLRPEWLRIPGRIGVSHTHDVRRDQNDDFLIRLVIA